MKNILTVLFLFICYTAAFAQSEADNWYFGDHAGIRFLPDGSVAALGGSAMFTTEGCSTISDNQGNLLFYTDGRNVWDKNHMVMPNGNYAQGTGLLGDPSSTQSGIIIPDKTNNNIYYIFTVDEPHHQNAQAYPNQFTGTYDPPGSVPADDDGFNNGLNYSVVNLSVTGTNGSIGDVTSRNNPLITYDTTITGEEIKYKCSEKITAITNASGNGYWVITHFVNRFYAFLVDAAGVTEQPVVTEIAPVISTAGYRRNAIGCFKASPNGNKLAIAHVQDSNISGSTEISGSVYLYDFNNITGTVSNAVQISANTSPYGLEFSPQSSKLYVTYDSNGSGHQGLHQYDLLSADVAASDVFISNLSSQATALQLGPNGKIYRAVHNSNRLDVINNPEEAGALCNYVQNAISLNGTAFFGLPPFITSLFAVNITAKNTCLNGSPTQFTLNVIGTIDSVTWDFGDNSPASVQLNPVHSYQAAGTYTVTATITSEGVVQAPFTTVIVIAETPVANPAGNVTECDPENDGNAVFNFTGITNTVLGQQDANLYSVRYFLSQDSANSGIGALGGTTFTSLTNPQTIYVRIENRLNAACFDTTSFEISSRPTPNIVTVSTETACANGAITVTLDAGALSDTAGYTYEWSTGAVTPTINVTRPGIYTVRVMNQYGCDKVRTITVIPSELAVIASVDITDITDNNSVTVNVDADTNSEFLYSLDKPNGPFQASNFFYNVSAGQHTVYVSNANGCGVVSEKISVLQIPKFFTPNGDFTNETWNIIGVNSLFYANSTIFIYDRYGKLLAGIDPKGKGWDGMYNNHALPADDYWYVVTLDNGRIVKGHFSLVR